MTISTGRPVEWIESLSDRDGQTLSMTFWRVNSGFFMRRLVFGGALAKTLQHLVNPSPSAPSSTPSSEPDTGGTPTTSPGD